MDVVQALKAVVEDLDVGQLIEAISAIVIAVFAIVAWWTARNALAEARRQAEAAHAAVEAAKASVVEARRQSQLARIPFLQVERPQLGYDDLGAHPAITLGVWNLGPGPALELRLKVERQDRDNPHWYEDTRGTPPVPLAEEGVRQVLAHSAQDLRNANADWADAIQALGRAAEPARPPIVPVRLRFSLSYLSATNGRGEQVRIWETDRLHLPPDPWTWRLETLTLDPGPESGEPLVVRRPD